MRIPTIVQGAAAALLWIIVIVTRGSAGDLKIAQRDRAFWPNDISIKVGDRLMFANEDDVTHNVYSMTKGLQFEIRSQQPGQSDVVPFSKPGIVDVQCAIHSKMKMRVRVGP